MTKVSTRPRKGATTVTETATAVAVASSRTDAQRVEDEGQTLEKCLKAVRDVLHIADQKLEDAYDATKAGEPLELLLGLIGHDLMADAIRPVLGDDIPSQNEAEAAYEAMFAPLAALEAAIALAGDHVVVPNLQEAWRLFDWANSQLGSNCDLWSLLPAASSGARDFNRGRDLAIKMIGEADILYDEREGFRWMRNGNAQDNFVKGYMTDVIADPTLLHGFTSILSVVLRNDDMDVSYLRQITLAETQAGEVGADGTQTEERASSASVAAIADTQPTRPDEDGRRVSLASEANHEIDKLAEAMIRLLETDRGDDFLMYHGILRRIQALSSINFFALRFHGDLDQAEAEHNWGDLATLGKIERVYEGCLS